MSAAPVSDVSLAEPALIANSAFSRTITSRSSALRDCNKRASERLSYRPCQRCGEFYTPDRNNGWKQNYCSKECRYNAERKYLDALPSRLCEACGEPCPMNKYSAGTKCYCSERCASRIQMRRRRARTLGSPKPN